MARYGWWIFIVLFAAASVGLLVEGHYLGVLGLILSGLGLLILGLRYLSAQAHINVVLERKVPEIQSYEVAAKELPGYRFVDVFNAIETLAEADPRSSQIASKHEVTLDKLLFEKLQGELLTVQMPSRCARVVDHDAERFFPRDGFTVLHRTLARDLAMPVVLRLWQNEYGGQPILEVAANKVSAAEALVEEVFEIARRDSIYRNRTIEVSFGGELRQTPWGEVEASNEVDIAIKAAQAVSAEDIVLDAEVKEVLERNIVDLHRRRAQLADLGVPVKRGLLFYGPPGTGKTYTCKHIAHRLEDATVVVAAGHALHHAKSVFNVARMLQPAVVVLEDVDLVFTARDQNIHGSAVGELLDELDGFASKDEIVFILTTNAIERVESAIKDRPGRISQCLHFGLPNATLRERYLRHYLQPYGQGELDLAPIVEATDRSSQAFLKEYVFRAVQIASEGDAALRSRDELRLSNEHFSSALEEMKRGSGKSGGGIVGFFGRD